MLLQSFITIGHCLKLHNRNYLRLIIQKDNDLSMRIWQTMIFGQVFVVLFIFRFYTMVIMLSRLHLLEPVSLYQIEKQPLSNYNIEHVYLRTHRQRNDPS